MVYDILIDGKFLYTANKASDDITVYDMETKQKKDIKSGGAGPVALSIYPEKKKLYAANITSSNVSVIDLNALTVEAKIETGKWPSYLYLAPDKKYLYVTCQYTNTIELIDTEKERNVLVTIPVGTSPVSIIPIGGKNLAIVHEWEYAFNNQSNIVIINRANYSVVKSILIDGGVYSGEMSKSKRYMFLTVPAKDKIIFMDIKNGEKVFEIQFKDDFPKWLALSPNGKTLYISAQHAQKIIIVKTNGLI
jgi:YVTN family beta-propeller protein